MIPIPNYSVYEINEKKILFLDINECAVNKTCHKDATCANTNGSYTCTCKQGYSGNGKQCENNNECKRNPCSSLANCTNTPGSYYCGPCPKGYTGNGHTCSGILHKKN